MPSAAGAADTAREARDAGPMPLDARFYRKRKHSWEAVDAPRLAFPIADTHTHLQLLDDPAFHLARCGLYDVRFVCTIVDVVEDGTDTFEQLNAWIAGARDLMGPLVASLASPLSQQEAAPTQEGTQPPEQASTHEGALSLKQTRARAHLLHDHMFTPRVPRVRIACGCHPHNAKDFTDEAELQLRTLLHDHRVCAVGEIGLDYHYDFSPREVQREVFRRQIRLAKEAKLPVILHLREAHDDGFAILSEEGFPEAGTLLHCYNLDAAELRRWNEAGCFIAFGGPLTFKQADEVRDAALTVPIDRLLTETDAPYMTPEPLRGIKCGPEYVIFTAARMAALLGDANGAEVSGLSHGEAEGEQGGNGTENAMTQVFDNALRLLDRRPTVWQRRIVHAASTEDVSETNNISSTGDIAHAGNIANTGNTAHASKENPCTA